jgi:NAD(P)-dependent dehydrogenase (short-subunit alcohol dehydrogenase family)
MSLITSVFGARSTASEVAAGHDLSGRKAIVTGGASGLGLATARALAQAGAQVIVAARSATAAQKAIDSIGEHSSFDSLDLADRRSIEAFATRHTTSPLHILINNAGVMATPLGYTAAGFETQIGINHFGHALLTTLLKPALIAGAPARVVQLTSLAHVYSAIDFDDMHYTSRAYDKWQAYGQSKTANALFVVGATQAWAREGIFANAVMPGGIMTNLQRELTMDEMTAMGWFDAQGNQHPMFKSAEQGAATSVWAAVGSELEQVGGLYLEDCAQAGAWHPDTSPYSGVAPHASDPGIARRLWEETTAAW